MEFNNAQLVKDIAFTHLVVVDIIALNYPNILDKVFGHYYSFLISFFILFLLLFISMVNQVDLHFMLGKQAA